MAVVVAFILLAGGGTVAYLRLRPAGGTAVNAAASPTISATPVVTVPPTKPPFAGDLRTLLLTKPASAKVEKGSHPSTNGNISIDNAAKMFGGDSTILNTLKDLGFKGGAVTGWSDKGYVVFIELFQFASLADTAEWLIDTQRAWADSDELESTAYFEGIVGARWFVDKKESGAKQAMYGLFSRATIWALITVYCPTKPDVKVLTTLVNNQYQRLPAE